MQASANIPTPPTPQEALLAMEVRPMKRGLFRTVSVFLFLILILP